MKMGQSMIAGQLLLLVFLLFLASASARAGIVESFKVGAWHVDAFTNETTGRFDSCVAIVRYRSGISMSVQVDANYDWWIGFSAPGWTMTPGEKIELQYRIDRGAWQAGTAEAVSPELARMAMPADGYIITRFRRGRTLYVYDGAYHYEFRLTGTSRLMARLAKCVDTHSSRFGAGAPLVGNAAPASGGSSPAPSGTVVTDVRHADPQLQIEAAQVLFNLMGKSGLLDLSLVGQDDRDAELRDVHAVAASDARTLSAHIMKTDSSESEREVMSTKIAEAAKRCDGDFSSGSGRKTFDDKDVLTGQSVCRAGDYELAERYAIVGRGAGGVYVFALSDTSVGESGGGPVSPGAAISADVFNAAAAAVAN